MACIEETEAELSAKKLEALEVKLLGGDSEELEFEWRALESKMDLLVHTADVMRKNLMERGLLAMQG
nr:putative RNA-directed DNA polymerase, eukaryota, reverse transcriptase zinc-binding domain protein [Tanacetum cinerariifolium]